MIPKFLAISKIVNPGSRGTNDIHGIRPPVPIPDYWLWLGLALGSLALCILLYAWWRWRKNRQAQCPPVPVIPAHERARQKLEVARGLIDQPEPFIVAVSDAIRTYLEERFDFRAPERTTEEFLAELRGTPLLNVEQQLSLGGFLQRCDLVKFARYEPGRPELEAIYDAALKLIEDTAPGSQDPSPAASATAVSPG